MTEYASRQVAVTVGPIVETVTSYKATATSAVSHAAANAAVDAAGLLTQSFTPLASVERAFVLGSNNNHGIARSSIQVSPQAGYTSVTVGIKYITVVLASGTQDVKFVYSSDLMSSPGSTGADMLANDGVLYTKTLSVSDNDTTDSFVTSAPINGTDPFRITMFLACDEADSGYPGGATDWVEIGFSSITFT